MDHLVKVKVKAKVSKRTPLSAKDVDSLELEYNETVDWFERDAGGVWRHKELEPVKDLWKVNPGSNSFTKWRDHRYYFACVKEVNINPPQGLIDAIAKVPEALSGAARERAEDKAAERWIADHGHEYYVEFTDKAGLGLNTNERSGGGGGLSKVVSNSRRRVVYFDIGFKGNDQRVSATQIIEMVNGRPTIHEFFYPAISQTQANDPSQLAAWRNRLNPTT